MKAKILHSCLVALLAVLLVIPIIVLDERGLGNEELVDDAATQETNVFEVTLKDFEDYRCMHFNSKPYAYLDDRSFWFSLDEFTNECLTGMELFCRSKSTASLEASYSIAFKGDRFTSETPSFLWTGEDGFLYASFDGAERKKIAGPKISEEGYVVVNGTPYSISRATAKKMMACIVKKANGLLKGDFGRYSDD